MTGKIRRLANADSMLGQSRRRCANIKLAWWLSQVYWVVITPADDLAVTKAVLYYAI